ncbi:hypothetical protein PMI42_00119 [Bradyrhizobium sp. YR681]|uniref:hypothetical protein n=1 Tax=Bradyrhizobium sp. YR681 TaxID=1144344 RepID=UPI000270EE1C|nr:hypothetical protein [Bradyrhizobium sp. YR681]EJN16284.1 hypothetical protein PMI42_00119 [Bradyrhizobium sp. YR681]
MADVKRGRPKGSGKTDGPTLDLVANAIVRDPKLKPTTAMLRIIRSRTDWNATEPTLLRRLQGKWKEESATLLSAARERASRAIVPTSPADTSSPALSVFEQCQRWLDSPVGKAAMGYVNSTTFQEHLSQVTSPGFQAELTRVEKIARGMIDDGTLSKRISKMQELNDRIFGLDKGRRGPW